MRKWQLNDRNERVPDFWLEDACPQFLEELRGRWSVADRSVAETHLGVLNNSIVQQGHYTYCRVGHDFRQISLLEGGDISASDGAREKRWAIGGTLEAATLLIWDDHDVLCELSYGGSMFHGQWLKNERVPIVLLPLLPPS